MARKASTWHFPITGQGEVDLVFADPTMHDMMKGFEQLVLVESATACPCLFEQICSFAPVPLYLWSHEDGSVCPFDTLFPCFVVIFVRFEASPCDGGCGLVEFFLRCMHFGCFRALEPKFTICYCPFTKQYVFKEECPVSMRNLGARLRFSEGVPRRVPEGA